MGQSEETLSLRFNHEGFCDGHKAHRKTPRVRPLHGLRQLSPSMRGPTLSRADVAAVTVPQQPRQLRPYAMLLSALSWGRLCSDPVHNEVRPDGVGAAIYSSVSPKEGHRLTRSHQRPDVSGAGHRSYSSVLFLPSVRALILSGVASTLPLAALHSVSQAISSPKAPDN